MAEQTNQPQLAPAISETLALLRRRIRRYVWLEGLALALACLGLAFWLSLAVDWLPVTFGHDEPNTAARIAMLAIVGSAVLFIFFWLIVRRAFVHLPNRSMALLLERRFREFDDSLLTTVELTDLPGHAEDFNRDMLETTGRHALQQTGHVELARVFNPWPLMRNLALAVLLSLSVVTFAMGAPESFETWFNRVLLLKDTPWPRRNHIEIEGGRVRKVARGEAPVITVRTDATNYEVPRVVRVYYETDDGGSGQENMIREGAVRDGHQYFTYTFKPLLDSATFEALGGDYRVRDYRIEVVDSPTAELTLACKYPAYMVNAEQDLYTPRDLPVTGVMQLPQGTHVTVRAAANKPIVAAEVSYPGPNETSVKQTVDGIPSAGAKGFSFTLGELSTDTTLEFRLVDIDGIRSKDPIRLQLVATPDETPQVELRLRGIGLAVTPNVRIPVEGTITDDYGVVRNWFEYQIDEQPPVDVAFRREPGRRSELTFNREDEEVLDIQDLSVNALREERDRRNREGEKTGDKTAKPGEDEADAGETKDAPDGEKPKQDAKPSSEVAKYELKPGQKLFVTMKARDACTLEGGSHTGVSQRFALDVVTEEELRGILNDRERVLRQRFEQIIGEMSTTRDSLMEVTFEPRDLKPPEKKTPEKDTPDKKDDPKRDDAAKDDAAKPAGDKKETPAASEPGEAEKKIEITPQMLRAVASLSAQRAQQISTKNSGEVEGVAAGFEDIQDELDNNRLLTEELTSRLRDGVSIPLRRIVEKMFPDFQKKLETLDNLVLDQASAKEQREQALQAAQKQADAILVEMDLVRAKMLEFEEFNEAIKLVREILEAQKQLNQATKDYRKWKILNE